MAVRTTGKYLESSITGETVKAFVPTPLPPEPPVDQSKEPIASLLLKAVQGLGELKVAARLVPSRDWFAYSFLRMEAVLSSQIEGTQATLTDLLEFEALEEKYPDDPDLQEVCNYLAALEFAKKELKSDKGLPLSLRLLKEMHKRLMKGVRGQNKQPGEFRESQNWIGGPRPSLAHFVPPPPSELNGCLDQFEKFLHSENKIHPLIKIGLLHVQFETIHPFLDGNGRLGRLLISLLMEEYGFLDARLLYLSLYFKRHQSNYYQRLDNVRGNGDWEGWIAFFLDGIASICQEAVQTTQNLFDQFESDRKRLLEMKDPNINAIQLFEKLPEHPIILSNNVPKILDTTKPTASKAIAVLEKMNILTQVNKGERNRILAYSSYVAALKTSGKSD